MSVYMPYKKIAEKVANIAGQIIKSHFRSNVEIMNKEDTSPVTAADREAENAIRGILETEYPDHGIFGEEYGSQNLDAEYVWVLDPIDGTKSFITGKPLFGTLIALCQNSKPVLGIIDQPILNDRWIGMIGHPTTHNGNIISTRSCANINDAWLSATSPDMFAGEDKISFDRLAEAVKFSIYGGDCYAYGLLASGFSDIICEATMQPYDYCALVPVVEGAGGKISNWSGETLNMSSNGKILATGDAMLHQEVINILSR